MEVEYGVQNNDPKLIFRSSVTVKDKDVGLKYTHAVKAGGCSARLPQGRGR